MEKNKFRAWNNIGQTMHYGGFSIHASGKLIVECFISCAAEDLVVEQFLNRRDVNGVDIYVGDIVDHVVFKTHEIISLEQFYKVTLTEIGEYGWRGDGKSLGFMVLGNIHTGWKQMDKRRSLWRNRY